MDVELGKEQIIEHLKDLMVRHGIDSTELVFHWDDKTLLSRWILQIFRGPTAHALRFFASDVQSWGESPETAQRYAVSIRAVLEKLKAESRD